MKKKLMLVTALLLTMTLLSSCAYVNMLGLSHMDFSGSARMDRSESDTVVTQTPVAAADTTDTVTISASEYERLKQFEKLADMMEIAESSFYEDVDSDYLLETAAMGLLAGLNDHYTFYYTAEQYEALWEDDNGEYAGIGIQISSSYETGLCVVSRVFAGSPSEAADVHRGDILYQVGDDLLVTPDNINDAVDIMRGTPGTDVVVTFLRDGEKLVKTLTRAKITINRVDACMLTDEVGYICLYEFAGDCAKMFKNKLNELLDAGANGVIIDLRDNPGGWVNDAQSIADLFVDKGVVCTLRYKDGTEYAYRSTKGKQDVELVILMNENSASSSEILAGCLQDRANATVVGVQSYGKGIVQEVIPLEDGSGMQITVAQYYTPNGHAVHKLGITPDVEVELAEGDNGMHEIGDLSDAQLAKALEVMEEKLAAETSEAQAA